MFLISLGQYAFSRAYICFKNSKDIFSFKDRFDNYIFIDSKSNEYPAIVEYSPYQRRVISNSTQTKKKDSRVNTIDQDHDYLKFLETLNKVTSGSLPSCEDILLELEQRKKEKNLPNGSTIGELSTPLLEFLRRKKDDKKLKDVILMLLFNMTNKFSITPFHF